MEKSLSRNMTRRLLLLPLVAAGCGLWLAPADAQTAPLPRGANRAPDAIRPLLGAWELEQIGASRSCTVTLGVEETAQGRQIRFPATCRRALSVLSEIEAWNLGPNGRPQLRDAAGKVVIAFDERTADSGFQGKGQDGKQYALASKDHPRAARRPPPSTAERDASVAQRPTPVDPASAPAMNSLPGRYVLMRQQNREACRIVLTATPVATDGRAPAALESGCQDTGLTIFDPVGWRYSAGRLTLVARKGHGVDLVFENSQWRKDPPVGAPLLLRKLAP
jgi:hypothetical protein